MLISGSCFIYGITEGIFFTPDILIRAQLGACLILASLFLTGMAPFINTVSRKPCYLYSIPVLFSSGFMAFMCPFGISFGIVSLPVGLLTVNHVIRRNNKLES